MGAVLFFNLVAFFSFHNRKYSLGFSHNFEENYLFQTDVLKALKRSKNDQNVH